MRKIVQHSEASLPENTQLGPAISDRALSTLSGSRYATGTWTLAESGGHINCAIQTHVRGQEGTVRKQTWTAQSFVIQTVWAMDKSDTTTTFRKKKCNRLNPTFEVGNMQNVDSGTSLSLIIKAGFGLLDVKKMSYTNGNFGRWGLPT